MSSSLRLAASNIAWMPEQDDAIADLLVAEGVSGVEIAPTKWRERPLNASAIDVAAYRRAWEDRGLRIVSMQSLLFGRSDLQLFATESQREATVDYLRRTIDLGAALGARTLVFGSPKNRARGSMPEREATSIAIETFRELGAHAGERDVLFCLEANPPEYGCDFITTTAEAVSLCRAVDQPGFCVNADLGGMTLSHDDPGLCVADAAGAIGHFHASEPHLSELGASSDHQRAAEGLARIQYPGWVSIEMRNVVPFASEANVEAVGRAVRLAKSAYHVVIA
jgi:sugar phosphate isomerase/epimerase